jgi:sensor domain CHASE-containing protein
MIQFEGDTRDALLGAGVLMIDENGKTVFTGLTAAETRFVLDFEESDLWTNQDKTHLFQELLAKFHAARELTVQNAKQLANERLIKFRGAPLAR